MEKIKVFISYSWDNSAHQAWVEKLARTLEEIEEITVSWDGYDLDSLTDKHHFMESGIYDADYVLLVTTAEYRKRADDRVNGVGIETYLATSVHWKMMLKEGRSKIVMLQREAGATPRYLEGHLFLDFSDDALYPTRTEELIHLLQGKPRVERPKKRRSLAAAADTPRDFTRVEDLIKVNHPNRRAIVTASEGTDFSGQNRVKYELWETRSPSKNYFLALHASGNIRQSVLHAADKLKQAGLRPSDITVLKTRAPRAEQDVVVHAFSEADLQINVFEVTYKEYIWDFCIDETLKSVEAPESIENYTSQSMTYASNETGLPERSNNALDYIADALQRPSNVAAHLIVAPGGMGKTSLCLSVAKRLHEKGELRTSVILIQAEAIKKHVAEQGIAQSKIESIYDIYELYARYHGHGRLFERLTFDLGIVCGNLTIIIDGLDELSSLFQERFDVNAFLESLKTLHGEQGSSKILLTTRNNIVGEDARLEALGIERYELLGFDMDSCRRYVKRRFSAYTAGEMMLEKVMAQMTRIPMQDGEGRIIPFLADIAATVVEDELSNGSMGGLEMSEDETPYPSNNEITDHIIHSILRRERTRHSMEISEVDVVECICDLVTDFGKRWPTAQMGERLAILYESRAATIASKLSLNPLLVTNGSDTELRYSFLASYFEVLAMLRGLSDGNPNRNAIRAISRLTPESEEAIEVKRYFRSNPQVIETSLTKVIPALRTMAQQEAGQFLSRNDIECAKGAIASLLNLYFSLHNFSIQETTERLLSFFGVEEDSTQPRMVSGLFIKGAFPTLDFSRLTVSRSRFIAYRNLMNCRFDETLFTYTIFEDCAEPSIKSTQLLPSMIETTCDPGNLREAFEFVQANRDNEKSMLQLEATRLLGSFYRGDRFVDKKREFIKFSTRVPGLAQGNFDSLVAAGFFVLAKEKTVGDFYEVAPHFQKSVRRFLSDNLLDAGLKRFLAEVR